MDAPPEHEDCRPFVRVAGLMAEAFRLGVEAGRRAYLAGRIPKKAYASASSAIEGVARPAAGS